MNKQEFFEWESASRDTVDFKRVYFDLVEDHIATLVLCELIYWHLPGKNGKIRLRVERDGYLWVATRRSDWWERTRVTPYQADRAIRILSDLGFVEKRVFKFYGNPTTHLRVIWEKFLPALARQQHIAFQRKELEEQANEEDGADIVDNKNGYEVAASYRNEVAASYRNEVAASYPLTTLTTSSTDSLNTGAIAQKPSDCASPPAIDENLEYRLTRDPPTPIKAQAQIDPESDLFNDRPDKPGKDNSFSPPVVSVAVDSQPADLDDDTLSPEDWVDQVMSAPRANAPPPRTTSQVKAGAAQALEAAYKKNGGLSDTVRGTDLAFLQDNYLSYGEMFADRFGRGPLRKERALWVREIRAWIEMGLSVQEIDDTITRMRRGGLSITGPQSVTGMAWNYKAEQIERDSHVYHYVPPPGAVG